VSLLKAAGHPQAHLYPLCVVIREQDLIRRRENSKYRTMAVLTQSAHMASKSKKAVKEFEKLLKEFE
jgi:DNA-binding IclR family transcriptional regulator